MMKGPSDQAKLLLFALLRSTATALATTGEKSAASRMLLPTNLNIQLRLATKHDVPGLQRCNLACLPENYNAPFYCSHLKQWPELALVAEHVPHPNPNHPQQNQHSLRRPFQMGQPSQSNTPEPKIVAYVLGKVESRPIFDYNDPTSTHTTDQSSPPFETIGHVTSLAVLQDYRRQGLAQALMTQLHFHLEHYQHCVNPVTACGLHVRKSNIAACRLYQQDGYELAQIIPSYYQDGEDAFFMKKTLPLLDPSQSPPPPQAPIKNWKRDFRNSQCWKYGPDAFLLPRRHELPLEEEDSEEQSTASSSSSSSSSPELLTGTM
jgi:ribosomal protein S18 acetylase RimI-like enzyme